LIPDDGRDEIFDHDPIMAALYSDEETDNEQCEKNGGKSTFLSSHFLRHCHHSHPL
jgi:hypothetical protein